MERCVKAPALADQPTDRSAAYRDLARYYSAIGAHGSAANVRSREIVNGPNFDERCERPVTRVLYAIENGGFSGAIMPQNIVVGQDAMQVAKFVATYAGRQAPKVPGVVPCLQQSVGTLPAAASTTTPTATTASTGTATTQSSTGSGKKSAKKGKSSSG